MRAIATSRHRPLRSARKTHNGHASIFGKQSRLKKIKGNTVRLLAKSIKNAKTSVKHIPKDVDRFVTNRPYQTMGVLMLASLALGYYIHK